MLSTAGCVVVVVVVAYRSHELMVVGIGSLANRYAKNERGLSAQDMANQDPYSDLARLLAEKERGDLW